MKASKEGTGSGFIVSTFDGKKVVSNHTFVSVRKFGDATKYTAKVLHIGHDCDVAMLTVENPNFWRNVVGFEFGNLPHLQDQVTVVGFPTGGDNISVTQGVVSRIEMVQYSHSTVNLLCVQIDAAINSGNSGGPVLQNGKCIGIAFQNLQNAENIGYIIPTPIITQFLRDVEKNGRPVGFPILGVMCQSMENWQMRKYFNMKEDQSGLLINNVSPVSAAHSLLKRDDVILSIDGTKLANDSTIIFRNTGERIAFEYLLTQKFVGDSCELEILRNGQVQKVTVKTIERPNLVPPVSYDTKPSYFVFAGLVFEKFVQPYLHENGEDWYNNSPRRLCHKAIYGEIKEVDEEVVILAHVLIDEINYGYGDLTYAELSKFNGTRVKNLKHLAEMIDKNTQEYFKFEFSEHPVIIIEAKAVKEAQQRIMNNHAVPFDRSQDIPVFNTKK